jgi:RNA polymerase sigma-70 factor (ECF subfamily)
MPKNSIPGDFSNNNSLLEQLKSGSIEAFDYLYLNSRNRLFALAHSILNDEQLAKDIVQDFFTDFLENRLFNNITSDVKSYIFTAVKNRALKYIRSQDSQQRQHTALIFDLQDVPARSKQDEIEHAEHNTYLKQELRAAIDTLPRMAQQIFKMHYLEHLSHMQIAEKLGISKSTVSGHMDRALKQLRKYLKK